MWQTTAALRVRRSCSASTGSALPPSAGGGSPTLSRPTTACSPWTFPGTDSRPWPAARSQCGTTHGCCTRSSPRWARCVGRSLHGRCPCDAAGVESSCPRAGARAAGAADAAGALGAHDAGARAPGGPVCLAMAGTHCPGHPFPTAGTRGVRTAGARADVFLGRGGGRGDTTAARPTGRGGRRRRSRDVRGGCEVGRLAGGARRRVPADDRRRPDSWHGRARRPRPAGPGCRPGRAGRAAARLDDGRDVRRGSFSAPGSPGRGRRSGARLHPDARDGAAPDWDISAPHASTVRGSRGPRGGDRR